MAPQRTSQGVGELSQAYDVLREVFHGVLDLVYPPKCLICGEMPSDYFCETCRALVERVPVPQCSRCGAPLEGGPCQDCQEIDFCFASACAAGIYDGVLKEAVHQLKYSGHGVVAPFLSDLVVDLLRTKPVLLDSIACICAIPMHPRKQRHRGFNQSELIARGVSKSLAIPLLSGVLVRTKAQAPQVQLTGDARRRNMLEAFEVVRRDAVEGRTVLVLDDVFTTGSTCQAAALALIRAGASAVHVVTVARSI